MHINQYLIQPNQILAHRSDIASVGPETLGEHSDLVLKFYKKLAEENGTVQAVENCAKKLVCKFKEDKQEFLVQLLVSLVEKAVYFHDLGKINPKFQTTKMGNTQVHLSEKESRRMNSNHSLFSSILFFYIVKKEWLEYDLSEKEEVFLHNMLYMAMYLVSKHHGQLEDLTQDDQDIFRQRLYDMLDDLKTQPNYFKFFVDKNMVQNFLEDHLPLCINDNSFYSRKSTVGDEFAFYIYGKLLFSLLVTSDFYATSSYMNRKEAEFHFLTDKQKELLEEAYESLPVTQAIRNPDKSQMSEMNKLRSELFLEAEATFEQNKTEPVFYLEAPTGSGKTNNANNLSIKALKDNRSINKIIYVFPFNTLTTQTHNTIKSFLPSEEETGIRASIINSITPIMTDNATERREEAFKREAREELLRRQMIQSSITLTSHVNFFNYLFGTSRESHLGLAHLSNSVIILDEIQSYRNEIWKHIIHFLKAYAEILNMKIIIMSATLPPLEELTDDKEQAVYLIKNTKKYFQNPLFQKRVEHLDYSMLNASLPINQGERQYGLFALLIEQIDLLYKEKPNNRILIEFLTKASAREFYHKLNEKYPDKPVFELTGLDSKGNRDQILNFLKEEENDEFVHKDAILVATQVIEAGVDIDMDVGFKDISILDSEEQFLGRINRSSKRKGAKVFFFNLDRAAMIYRGDWRIEHDLTNPLLQEYLANKDFRSFYKLVINRLEEDSKRNSKLNFNSFKQELLRSNFKRIKTMMTLIDTETITLFLNYKVNGVMGEEVWRTYRELLADNTLDYAVKKVKLSLLTSKMADYTFSVYATPPENHPAEDVVGDMYFIANGDRYMELDGKNNMFKFNFIKFKEEQTMVLD
ncbi:CRISPR-associated helicase/endonuclease Cas3 [Priestia filamentosa]|uniref:CRISPR-associated helicase/endonuclease Cas3 n=1 Tax=Priestia filamentosa TaxID=1402861 RepID=UPI0005894F77